MKLKALVFALMSAGPLVASQPTSAADCCTPGDKDYPTHGGNLGNQSYSSLTQINKRTSRTGAGVDEAHVSARRRPRRNPSPGTNDSGQQTTPIVVDGVIYSTRRSAASLRSTAPRAP